MLTCRSLIEGYERLDFCQDLIEVILATIF
jgi:hypothetical protein